MLEKSVHTFMPGFLRKTWVKQFAINGCVALGLGLMLILSGAPNLVGGTDALVAYHGPAGSATIDADADGSPSVQAAPNANRQTSLDPIQAGAPLPSRIVIKTRSESTELSILKSTGDASLDSLMTRFDVQTTAPLFDTDGGDSALKRDLGLSQIYVITLSSSTDLQDALSAFSADPAVEYAEPDFVGYGAGMPDDEWFDYQWNLHNTGQSSGEPDADIDAPEAWDISVGVTSTVLAIIDTGLDLAHSDLAAKVVDGYDFVNDDATPQDDHDHGTHVAGIAAAATNNGTGMAGVCPECHIMPLKALNSDNWGYYSWWANAIVYAVDHGADVINMSMGGTDYSQALRDAALYAYNANVPIVAATMNDGNSTLYYPAAFTETIAIGATDRNDNRWVDSNFGDHIDLVAPGASILGTIRGDTYAFWNGTSMGTPHVAGVLGLMHSVRPGYTVEGLRAALRATADDQVGPSNEDKTGWDPYFGSGRLNAAQAIQYVVPPTGVTISGPMTGLVQAEHIFTATISPITAALPLTYVWQATGQAPVIHTGGLSDTATFAWVTSGTQIITATATNFGGTVTGTHNFTVSTPPPGAVLTVCHGGGCDYDNIQEGVNAARDGSIIKVASGTYTGVNDYGNLAQVVYISKSVTIRGGYAPAFTDPPDPHANPTTIDAQGSGRVLYITSGVNPTIEGLRIIGGDAAGMGGGLGGGDAGGGVYVINANATIKDSQVLSNTARWGGGLYLWEGDATLSGNTFATNTARWGGGLYLESNSHATLNGNTFTANTADKDGGGLYLREGVTVLSGNTITANIALESAGGLYLYESESALNNNTVTANTARWGGGLYLWQSDAALGGNAVTANTAEDGGGLYLAKSDAILTNNVVAENQADIAGGGLYIHGSSPHLLHTTIVRNSGDGGVCVTSDEDDYSSVALTNTILVSHTVGITASAGNTVTLEATLWGKDTWANMIDWGGAGTVITGTLAHNYRGDPAFVAPETGDYHISPDSAALDAGVNAGVTADLDGDLRPVGAGYDVGADEFPAALSVTQQANPNPVQAGTQLTYTIRVTNTGDLDLHATIIDTLPDHVMPAVVHTWTPTLAASGGIWTGTVAVTVEMGYAGPLVNVVQVATAEGAMGKDTYIVVVAEKLATVEPSEGGIIVTPPADGVTTTVKVPPGAVTETTQLAYTSMPTVTSSPSGLVFAGRAFRLEAYREGTLHSGLVFEDPIIVTIYYTEADVARLDENTLELRYWSGNAWSADGITVMERDTADNRLVTTIEHLSEFAMFVQEQQQAPQKIYLPSVLRQYP
jgi:thermitase